MAYSRWHNSKFYIYWVAGFTKHRNQERLAIWANESDAEQNKTFDFLRVKNILTNGDFSCITEFEESDREQLVQILSKWIEEVESKWPKRKS